MSSRNGRATTHRRRVTTSLRRHRPGTGRTRDRAVTTPATAMTGHAMTDRVAPTVIMAVARTVIVTTATGVAIAAATAMETAAETIDRPNA